VPPAGVGASWDTSLSRDSLSQWNFWKYVGTWHAPPSLDGTIQGLFECTLPRTGHFPVGFLLDVTFGFLRLQYGTMHNIGLPSGSTT
jgi:hypothetical protein